MLVLTAPTPCTSIEKPDLNRFPGFVKATRTVGTIGQGECMFIPALWSHQVYTAECDNVAINFWYHPTVARGGVALFNLLNKQLFGRKMALAENAKMLVTCLLVALVALVVLLLAAAALLLMLLLLVLVLVPRR